MSCRIFPRCLLQDALKIQGKKAHLDRIHLAWLRLQTAVNSVFDSDLDKVSTDKQNGIKQVGFVASLLRRKTPRSVM